MLKKTDYIFFLLIWAACVLPPKSTSEIPNWASDSTLQKAGNVHATGRDENGRLESLVDALHTFSILIHSSIAGNDKQILFDTELKIGDISISGRTEKFSQEGTVLYSEFIRIISYSKDNASLIIESFSKLTGTDNPHFSGKDSQMQGHFEFTSENAGYSDLVKELENSGVVVKTAFDGKIHYTLLEGPVSIFKK